MGPESKFPAASEDVAAAYREVLKAYRPQHIGLYGCSAGGMLTGMSIAWFEKHNLPNPAAIGILCASLGRMFAGDSAHVAGPLMGMSSALPASSPEALPSAVDRIPAYLGEADPDDPLVYPVNSLGSACEVSADFVHHQHARFRVLFGSRFLQQAQQRRCDGRAARLGRIAACLLVQLRSTRVSRCLRSDCQVF